MGLGKLVPDILNKKRYAHQVFGNVGNFQIAYSDGIVVLTHIAWAAITTSVCKVSYDLQIKTWHAVPRFVVNNSSCRDWRTYNYCVWFCLKD